MNIRSYENASKYTLSQSANIALISMGDIPIPGLPYRIQIKTEGVWGSNKSVNLIDAPPNTTVTPDGSNYVINCITPAKLSNSNEAFIVSVLVSDNLGQKRTASFVCRSVVPTLTGSQKLFYHNLNSQFSNYQDYEKTVVANVGDPVYCIATLIGDSSLDLLYQGDNGVAPPILKEDANGFRYIQLCETEALARQRFVSRGLFPNQGAVVGNNTNGFTELAAIIKPQPRNFLPYSSSDGNAFCLSFGDETKSHLNPFAATINRPSGQPTKEEDKVTIHTPSRINKSIYTPGFECVLEVTEGTITGLPYSSSLDFFKVSKALPCYLANQPKPNLLRLRTGYNGYTTLVVNIPVTSSFSTITSHAVSPSIRASSNYPTRAQNPIYEGKLILGAPLTSNLVGGHFSFYGSTIATGYGYSDIGNALNTFISTLPYRNEPITTLFRPVPLEVLRLPIYSSVRASDSGNTNRKTLQVTPGFEIRGVDNYKISNHPYYPTHTVVSGEVFDTSITHFVSSVSFSALLNSTDSGVKKYYTTEGYYVILSDIRPDLEESRTFYMYWEYTFTVPY